MENPFGLSPEEKMQLAQYDEQRRTGRKPAPYEDDGARYIFPAGEVAPGSNIAPSKPEPIPNTEFNIPQPVPSNETFLDPNEAPIQTTQSGMGTFSELQRSPYGGDGLEMEATAAENLGNQQAGTYKGLEKEISKISEDRAANQAQMDEYTKSFEGELAKTQQALDSFKVEPSNFFSNKSTWQKIVGGIGMFLGSITPEGARNVASIVNNEIDRDIKRQEMEYSMLKEKRNDVNNRFAQKMNIFKNKDLALSSLKMDAYSATDLQLKRIESSAKGDLVRAKVTQAREALQFEKDKEIAKFQTAMTKASSSEGKLDAGGRVRYDAAKEALDNVRKMRQLLNKGSNTFSLIGDNSFTLAQRKFAENYGRMQSGGVVGKEERDEFMGFTPGIKDTKATQMEKLNALEAELQGRLRTLGKEDPQEKTKKWLK